MTLVPALVTFGIEWARPLGLASLALPVLLLLAARVPGRPRELATGTLPVWRSVDPGAAPHARRARPSVPPFVWLVALALLAGGLALGGPRPARADAVRTWTLVVDASPSMALPVDPDDRASPTRAEAARERARRWLRDELRETDEVLEVVADGASVVRRPEPTLSEELVPGRTPRAEPAWAEHDRPGTLWVTDRAPPFEPLHAGFSASGGAAVPGPVAARGATRVDWDGARLVEVPDGARPPALRWVGAVPRPLSDVLAAWAAARGLALRTDGADAGSDVVLVVLAAAAGDDALECVAGRDGWTVAGRVARPPAEPEPCTALDVVHETWLAHDGVPVVRAAPGHLHAGWVEMAEPAGDPAAFAVSWARLLDRVVLPPDGVVSLAERRAAGEPAFRAPAAPPVADVRTRAPALDAWLAGLAAVLALAALPLLGAGDSRPAASTSGPTRGPGRGPRRGPGAFESARSPVATGRAGTRA